MSRSRKHEAMAPFCFSKFKGMGCAGTSLPPSTPAIIRSAADWETRGSRKLTQKKKKKASANPANVAIDVPDVCCTPPGIGISSDFTTRNRRPATRKHTHESRRNENGHGSVFGIGSRNHHRSADEMIEMLISQQTLLAQRNLRGQALGHEHDPYHDWRLDVDEMSYEELLDLGERIGYVGTGLKEDEIPRCLKIIKQFSKEYSASLLINDAQRDLKCSICQEKCANDHEIGVLECGHHYHAECIKQWLMKKNSCPICKCAAMPRKVE